jgi:WD40 repeat protein
VGYFCLSNRCPTVQEVKIVSRAIENLLGLRLFIVLLCSASISVSAQSSASINDIAWNTDGTRLAVARNGGVLSIYDSTLTLINEFVVADDLLTSVEWRPNVNDELAVSSRFGEIFVLRIQATTFQVITELGPVQNYVRKITWSPDGQYLATIGETGGGASSEHALHVWEVSSGAIIATFAPYYSLADLAWNPNGTDELLISGIANNEGTRLLLWKPLTDTVVWDVERQTSLTNIAWRPNGQQFAALTEAFEDGGAILTLHNTATGAIIATLPTNLKYRSGIIWDIDSHLIVSGSLTLEIWSPEIPRLLATIQPQGAVISFSVRPGSTQLVYESNSIGLTTFSLPIEGIPTPEPTHTPTDTAEPTPAPTNTPTNTPTPANLITNISVANGKAYTRDTVAVGKTLYIDRAYSFVTVPAAYLGREYIRTANDDKQNTSASFLTFTLTADAWVYVMYDSRVTNLNLPGWLKGWIDTGETIVATEFNNTQLARRVFKRRYAAGSVTLGGNASGSTNVMYNVIAVPDPRNETSLYRVNAGGPEVVSGNITWNADNYFTGGTANSLPAPDVLNTADDILYFTERSVAPAGGIVYSFPVANGTYSVRLHFAEMYFNGSSAQRPSGTGLRVFDVQIEGATVLDEYDITAAVGAPMTADVRTFSGIAVSDGALTITFPPATVDHPTINAIEVFTVP